MPTDRFAARRDFLRATALLLCGAALAALLRRSAAGARHLVWLATLTFLLALPASLTLTPLRLPILPAELAPPRPAPAARLAPEPQSPRVPSEARSTAPEAPAAPASSAAAPERNEGR